MRDTGFQIPGDTTHFAGYAYDDRNAIALGAPWVADSMVVRHEFTHRIASPRGHNPLYFRDRCAALVSCNAWCANVPFAARK